MSASNVIKQANDGGTIAFADGTGTPLTLTLRFDNADFKVSGVSSVLREVVIYKGRGRTRGMRYGDPKYPSWSCSVQVADLSELSAGTVLDWIGKTTGSPYASRLSTLAIGEVDCQKVTFTQEGTSYGDGADQTLVLTDCTIDTWDYSEGAPNTISLSGTVYGDVKTGSLTLAAAPR